MKAVQELLNNKIQDLDNELSQIADEIISYKKHVEELQLRYEAKNNLFDECIEALTKLEETNGKIQE